MKIRTCARAKTHSRATRAPGGACILLDIGLPELDGLEVGPRVRWRPCGKPVPGLI